MEYRLIIKATDDTRILMTPMGVQIWMKGKRATVKSFGCEVCGGLIGQEPSFIPVAGPILLNSGERIHERCINTLTLLPMQTNPLLQEEEPSI
jgi:hypothetical protein